MSDLASKLVVKGSVASPESTRGEHNRVARQSVVRFAASSQDAAPHSGSNQRNARKAL
ncbi:Uncharacterised protein [Vibrio cholerae]|nr:Uncharacterised protein [Vibrio cholerae]